MKPGQKRMKKAVEYLTKYMTTYDKQYGYLDYGDETYIDDILYGLGVSLGDEYRTATGFDKFKAVLRQHLKCAQ